MHNHLLSLFPAIFSIKPLNFQNGFESGKVCPQICLFYFVYGILPPERPTWVVSGVGIFGSRWPEAVEVIVWTYQNSVSWEHRVIVVGVEYLGKILDLGHMSLDCLFLEPGSCPDDIFDILPCLNILIQVQIVPNFSFSPDVVIQDAIVFWPQHFRYLAAEVAKEKQDSLVQTS